MQDIVLKSDNRKIFLFDEVYPFRAAQEQAEKKKLNAFGMAKFNPLNRPKEDTVLLQRYERRYEPFWQIEAERSVDYSCQVNYPVHVHNPYAQAVRIFGQDCEVARQKDKSKIEIPVWESCHRKLTYAMIQDGMQRNIKENILVTYLNKYKYQERHELEMAESAEVLKPLLTLQGVIQQACAKLNGEAINAAEIGSDAIVFAKIYLYLRPVFAFEFRWTSTDKVGVIEVDGLTGEVVENGDWFKDKFDRVMTRETLIDVGAEIVGNLVPGGNVVVKIVGKVTQ